VQWFGDAAWVSDVVAKPRPQLVRLSILVGWSTMQLLSFARGAPSLDVIDVDGLKAAAARAFESDPAGITRMAPLSVTCPCGPG
jgi:hypothetical protein